MPKLEAIKEIRYAGKTYKAGDVFQAIDKHARVLKAIQRAKDAAEDDAPKAMPAPPQQGVIHSRAMTPEEPAGEAKVMTTERTGDITPRRYRRRDMTPGEE